MERPLLSENSSALDLYMYLRTRVPEKMICTS